MVIYTNVIPNQSILKENVVEKLVVKVKIFNFCPILWHKFFKDFILVFLGQLELNQWDAKSEQYVKFCESGISKTPNAFAAFVKDNYKYYR